MSGQVTQLIQFDCVLPENGRISQYTHRTHSRTIRRVCSWQPDHVHKGQPPASWSASVAIKNYHKLHCAPEFQHNFDQILKTLCHDKKNRLVKTRFTWEPQSVIVQSDSFAGLTNQVSTRSDKLSEEKIVQNRETPQRSNKQLWWSNHLNLQREWSRRGQLSRHALNNFRKHERATRQHDIGVQGKKCCGFRWILT